MSTLVFKFDRTRYTNETLTFQLHAIGSAGATEDGEQGPNAYPAKPLEADGTLAGYIVSAPNPAATGAPDPVAPPHYYVIRNMSSLPTPGAILDSRQFVPVQTSAGVLDVNVLLGQGKTFAVTPELLTSLTTAAAAALAAAAFKPDAQAAAAAKGDALAAAAARPAAQAAAAFLPGLGAAQAQAASDHTANVQQMADSAQAAGQALAATGIAAPYISETTADPPAAPDGTKGAKRGADGSLTRLLRTGGAWVAAGASIAGLPRLITAELAIGNKKTAFSYGASGGRSLDDRSALQNAIDGTPEGGILDLSASLGFRVSEALYLDKAITIVFNSRGSILEQTTFGKPHWFVNNAPNVHFRGLAEMVYTGARPNIKAAPNPTSADPRLNPLYQIGAGNSRTLAAGVYLKGQCDNFHADRLSIDGQVIGMIHANVGDNYNVYSGNQSVGEIFATNVDWGYLSGGVKDFDIRRFIIRNLTSTQGDPTHGIYMGPRAVYNGSLTMGVIDLDGAYAMPNNDDFLRAADAFSLRCCQLCTVESILVRNAQMLGNFQEGRFIVGKINAVLDSLYSGAGANTQVSILAAQSNADVTIQEMQVKTGIGWQAGQQDAFAVTISSSASLRVRSGKMQMTNPSPARVARMGGGALLDIENLEMAYDNPFDPAYVKPAAIYSLATTGQVRVKNPKLTGTDRLAYFEAGVDWRIHLDPTRIASNTLNTIFDAGNQYHTVFTAQHDAPPAEPAVAGTYAITLRSRNSVTVNNTANAFIAGFNAGVPGQRYMIFCTDAFTALLHNASLQLLGKANIAKGTWSWLEFVMVGGVAYEIGHGGIGAATTSTKTANYAVTPADKVILANAVGSPLTMTLPTAVGITDAQFVIKKTDASANAVTIATTSSQTIDGTTTKSLTTQYAMLRVVSDGANWQVI